MRGEEKKQEKTVKAKREPKAPLKAKKEAPKGKTKSEKPKDQERISTKLRKELFLKALRDNLGIKSHAMEVVGIKSYQTILNWENQDAEFAQALEEIYLHTGDFVEAALYNRINQGDTTAIIFYCKTKLKNRGYVERQEITGKDSADLLTGLKITVCDSGKENK